jgi:hypothetical protein
MENTVNNPEENPSLTSKMSDNSSEADFAPQTVVTWMMVSVAVGLLTIYTMIQLISNKLTQVRTVQWSVKKSTYCTRDTDIR